MRLWFAIPLSRSVWVRGQVPSVICGAPVVVVVSPAVVVSVPVVVPTVAFLTILTTLLSTCTL